MMRRRWRLVCLPNVLVRGLLAGAWLILMAAQAHAQAADPPLVPEHPSHRFVRSGSIMLGLAGASTAVAAGLLPTQPHDSWGKGVGIGHAVCALGYMFDGTMRLIHARGVSRAVRQGTWSLETASSWALWFNLSGAASLSAAGAVLAAWPGSDARRGVGVAAVAHGAWLLSFAIVQVARVRRGKPTWMAHQPGVLRF
jgi:hypothetical protein